MVLAELVFSFNKGQEVGLFGQDAKLFLTHIVSHQKEGQVNISINFQTGEMKFKNDIHNIILTNPKE